MGYSFAKLGGAILLVVGLISACDSRVYVRDGVTDGSRFALPAYAEISDDPVVQSWVAYSLSKSICQLEMGGDNPARNTSFDCELSARESLVDRWLDYGDTGLGERAAEADYLDAVADAEAAGFLDEYVWTYLEQPSWTAPAELELDAFEAWRAALPNWQAHRVQTRIIGSWGYPPGEAD
ncbi:MAG: hypothetical protein AAF290_00370 [Pseudomonadota bacterium]